MVTNWLGWTVSVIKPPLGAGIHDHQMMQQYKAGSSISLTADSIKILDGTVNAKSGDGNAQPGAQQRIRLCSWLRGNSQ